MATEDLFVLTGAPGTGKTAVLEALAGLVDRVHEPAREILAQQRRVDGRGTPDRDPSRFVELLLERAIGDHGRVLQAGRCSIFDRGVPDCIAYAQVLGVDRAASVAASVRYRYNGTALLLTPWPEIYAQDDERLMSFDQTYRFHDAVVSAYERVGYALLEVPHGPTRVRAAFVRAHIDRWSSRDEEPPTLAR